MQTTKPLRFSWYELMTKDVPAALGFYEKVFGWTTKDSGFPDYRLIETQGRAIGGALTLTDEMCAAGAKPGWLGYIGVDDLAKKTEEIVAKGGKVVRPMVEIPGMLQFTIFADPHGAVFALLRGLVEGEEMRTPPPGTQGAIDWRELHAGNGAEAWEFYSSLFGWSKGMAVDMGPVGIYQTWMAGPDGGGMMTKMPETPAPFWLYYGGVDGIDAAVERVKENGGTVIHGPSPVPGGSFIANCIDPQGAIFAMVSMKR